MDENSGNELDSLMPKGSVAGENITVKVASVVAFLTVFGASVWWARGLQSDVRSVQTDVAMIKISVQALDKMANLQGDVKELREYGSLVSRRIDRELMELRKEFELHKAMTIK